MADAGGPHRLELPVAVGAAADLRTRRGRHDGEVTVAWPSGAKERLTGLRAGRAYVITEGRGITSDTPLAR